MVGVTVQQSTEDAPSPVLTYEDTQGFSAISGIRLGSRTLRLPQEPLQGEPRLITYGDAPSFRFEAGKGWLAVVSPAVYKGDPALRFPVVHAKFELSLDARPCEGFLYVSAARVAYDPVFTPGGEHGFDASREEIRQLRHAETWNGNSLKVELGDRKLSFRALYERGEVRRASLSMKKGRQTDGEFWGLFLQAFHDIRAVQAMLEPAGM